MRVGVCLLLAAAGLSACASQRASAPALQRVDRLRPLFSRVTSDSIAVSTRLSRLEEHLQADEVEGVRADAVGLRQSATRLAADASRAQDSLRPVVASAHGSAVPRAYLELISRALARDRLEGENLMHAAAVLWHDPLLLATGDASRAQQLVDRARADASDAASAVREARRLRTLHPAAFRYVPVR